MIRRVLDTAAVTVAVALAGGAVMLGTALGPGAGDEALDADTAVSPTVGLVTWAVHAAPPAEPAPPPELPAALEECRHEVERRVGVEAAGAALLRIESGSGFVRVDGRSELGEVRVVARLCASERDYLDEMDVVLERQGARIELVTRYPENRRRVWRGNDYARIDLVVEAPAGIDADVSDGSGEIELNDLGAARVEDGSGEIRISRARGAVRIDDGSGSIELREIGGPVEIEDGSGGIDIDGVEGTVELADGSGSISVRGVSGDVRIRDGSGSISVRDVGGDLVVREDGSGSLDWSGVQGRVDVPSRHARNRSIRRDA